MKYFYSNKKNSIKQNKHNGYLAKTKRLGGGRVVYRKNQKQNLGQNRNKLGGIKQMKQKTNLLDKSNYRTGIHLSYTRDSVRAIPFHCV